VGVLEFAVDPACADWIAMSLRSSR